MERNAEAVLKEALTLSETDRADIAGTLLESLQPEEEAGVEDAWQQEVVPRVAALRRGGRVLSARMRRHG